MAKKRTYSEDEKHTAMAVYAFTSGQENRTLELLKENGHDIPWGTIKAWVYRNKDLYRSIKDEIEQHTRGMHADTKRRLSAQYDELQEIGLKDLKKELYAGNISGKDLGKLMKDLAIAGAVNTDKAEKLSDRPTAIIEHDYTDVKKALASSGVRVIEPMNVDSVEVDRVLPEKT